ncbi:MAG: nucleotidyltransferase family protein [Gemmatimonadales bacterium]
MQTRWNAVRLAGLEALVEYEGAEIWLYRRLRALRVRLTSVEGIRFTEWLGTRARKIAAADLLVDNQADLVMRSLAQLGVPAVLIKGAARRLMSDRFPLADARVTADVDVLIPHEMCDRVLEGLFQAGYRYQFPTDRTPDGHYHLRPLVDSNGVRVELHVSTSGAAEPAEAWRRATAGGMRAGADLPVQPATELLWHGLTHALETGGGEGGYRLRYFLDGTSVLAGECPLDWDELARRMDGPEVPSRKLAVSWLRTAQWFAGADIPSEILGDIPPFPLRRLLGWRQRVLAQPLLGRALREKALSEATRVEVGLPLTPSAKGRAKIIQLRRRTAAAVVRAGYLGWRRMSNVKSEM